MMQRLAAWLRRMEGLVSRHRRDGDLAAELDSHLQLHIDDNVRAGLSAAEARRQAVLALGGIEQTKEQVRDARTTGLDAIGRNLALAIRYASRRPWHVGTVVVMLAVGIGGSTAVFSFLYQVLLQPIGISEPSRLVEVSETTPPREARRGITVFGSFPYEAMLEQRTHNPAFAAIGMATDEYLALVAPGQEAQRVKAAFVSAGYFETLGVRLRMGLAFTTGDETTAEPMAIISDRLWTRAFGRDAGVLGRDVRVNGRSCRIVGVAPPGFIGHELSERVDAWMPWGTRAAFGLGPSRGGKTLARLRDGTTISQAAGHAAAIGDRYLATLSAEDRDHSGRPLVQPFDMNRSELLESLLPQPWLLLTGPLLMLLLACANVANLQLADIEVRQREFASRAALGASGGAIFRQVMSETLVPALAACGLGLWLAYPSMALLQRVPTEKMNEPRLDVVLQPQAAAFAVALALLSVLLVGLLPARRASRTSLADAVKAGSGTVAAAGRLKNVLIAVQVALALTMVTSGMLVTRSLDAARSQDLGLRPDGVVGMRLQFGSGGDARAHAASLQRLLEGARALPGVRVATVSAGFPLENAAAAAIATEKGGLVAPMVGPGYFSTIGVKILKGREFTSEDFGSEVRVIVVNQSAANLNWPGLDPIGRMLGARRVIGVVADHAAFTGMGMHEPLAFVRLPSDVGPWPCLLVRTDGNADTLVSSLRQLARQVDPAAPVLRVATLRDHLDGQHHHLRVASWLLGLCGLASLALAAMGVHSLLAYRVARQRKEIGLRMALGATRHAVIQLVVARTLQGVLIGLAAGGVGSFVLSRVFGRLFSGAATLDVWTLALGALTLAGAAVLASVVPSWHAVRIDPATTLRGD